jgi:ribosomal protein L11 methyltransferase
MNSRGNTTVARLVCDEGTARRVVDSLSDHFDSAATAVAAFEGPNRRWTVELHFEAPPDEAVVRALVAQVGGSGADLGFETITPKDWVAASFADLKPVIAGRFTVHGAHDRARIAPNRLGIEIEAALAFGTGHHGTTRGCLLALDALLKRRRPRYILDIGTGTGVLAIAAARRLRHPVLASDIDRQAVAIARENARLNGLAPYVECLCAGGLSAPRFRERAPFDLVLANILLAPLIRLAGPMRRLLAPRARVVLSGLLASQENAALAAYRPQGLKLVRRIPLGEWVTLVLSA